MVNRFQAWLNRQSLAVKLAIAVPLLLVGVLWSIWPSDSAPAIDLADRPVLGRETAAPNGVATAAARGATAADVPASSPAPSATTAPVLAPHQEPRPVESTFTWTTALRTLVSVAVVIALIVITARVLKYLMATAGQPTAGGAEIKVLETVHVPAPSGRGRAAMHLVEVADRLLLVGATDSQMTLLSEFDRGTGPANSGTLALPSPIPTPVPTPAPAQVPALPAGMLLDAAQTKGHSAPLASGPAHPAGFGELLAAVVSNGAKPVSTVPPLATAAFSAPLSPPSAPLARPASAPAAAAPAAHDDVSFGQAELAAMLQRLRESKTRLQSDN